MFLRQEIVAEAVERLSAFHPFFGITFLVCKHRKLPVGGIISVPINSAEEQFLIHYYHPNPDSRFFFQPFRTSSRMSRWLSPKYPSSGSQSTRTRGHFAAAFLHKRDTDRWGWSPNYVDVLREKLEQDGSGPVPAFWLATWLFRNEVWGAHDKPSDLVRNLLKRFEINQREQDYLFDLRVPNLPSPIFSKTQFNDLSFLQLFDPAPDASPNEGGTLQMLQLSNIGPARQLEFDPAERLSIITGDNGLGKTFLLECAWWALTGEWAGQPALPNLKEQRRTPSITFSISGRNGGDSSQRRTIIYDWKTHLWPAPKGRPTIPGLIVYARVDGSFAIWDPTRLGDLGLASRGQGCGLCFTRDEVLNGLGEKIEGVIRDWVRWQNAKDQSTFDTFCAVLERLSPPDIGPLRPGEPIRLPGDPRDIPTLIHDYALVPFTNESAGVKRIVTIAYLLVWAWNEHKVYARLTKRAPQDNIVIMIDEIEAHLHPKWQRTVLPALLDVVKILGAEVRPQMFTATHSPLILASMENVFLKDVDKLFHLYLGNNRTVHFEKTPFIKHGTIDAWLTSEIFELRQARSREGEGALERAKNLLAASDGDERRVREVHRELAGVLPPEDPFWLRWLHFAEVKGVKL